LCLWVVYKVQVAVVQQVFLQAVQQVLVQQVEVDQQVFL
jgi:hypothetical protein